MGQELRRRITSRASGKGRPRSLSGVVDLGDSRRVLVVENSRVTARLLAQAIGEATGRDTTAVRSLAEARRVLQESAREHVAAVVGLELPDASGTEIVELTLSHGVPTIVLTSTWDDETRQRIWEYDVFDYYLKAEDGLRAVCTAIKRIPRNPHLKILVVDDSVVYRTLEASLLRTHGFQVVTANDGQQALDRLEEHPDITLVLTDYEMPNVDGMELVARIRSRHPREELAVVGVSSVGTTAISVGFLKHGANDFLPKPFEKEEFYCRIYNSIETVEQMRAIQRSAFTDSLTGLRNRLHFFGHAREAFERCQRGGGELAMAMLDIDFFKKVNDTYGHAGGDVVLQRVADVAREHLHERGLLARFGGEEFCFLGVNITRGGAEELFEKVRAAIEASVVPWEGQEIRVTVSIGVAITALEGLDETINHADELLYKAKNTGRNRVVIG